MCKAPAIYVQEIVPRHKEHEIFLGKESGTLAWELVRNA